MVASNIKVFLRIRPSARASKTFCAQPDQGIISFELATDDQEDKTSIANNSKKIHKFRFDGILEMVVTQDQVFDVIAQPVIEDVLQGINGTIFAYGQTGSGKTFTITGGTERYADRGLIPRSIQYIFQAFRRGEANYVLRVSYLEIYQNDGYDLLVRDDRVAKIEELPRVELREDGDGNIHLRNLSVHTVHAPEEALDLLVIGDTNRVVAETPMNDASTRSHCMFILWIDSTLPGSDTVRRAKLHLVDLAGSERISKTGVEGKLQQEATQINLSLFYLAQVIESLSSGKKGKMHIPYRNSMMTSVLRDSLGGNCKTVMVGTVAVEDHCVDESISTCRFAQRVATIKNDASVNEELDPALLIKRLKNEVAALKDELQLLNGNGEDAEDISDSDRKECRQLVSTYLEEVDPEAPFVCGSVPRFRECFSILREVYWQRKAEDPNSVQDIATGGTAAGAAGNSSLAGGKATGEAAVGSLERAVLELRQQVVHRDQEIGMLVNSLNMRSKRKEVESASKDGPVFIRGGGGAHASKAGRPALESGTTLAAAAESAGGRKIAGRDDGAAGAAATLGRSADPGVTARGGGGGGENVPVADSATLLDRNKAFEVFRKSVRRTETLEENREAVVKLVQEAQSLGEKANAEKKAREKLKVRVEQARIQQQMNTSPRDPEAERTTPEPDGPEVQTMLQEMLQHTRNYKQYMQRLGQVKIQIEEFQKTAASNTERLQRDFEAWFATYAAQQGLSLPAPQAQQSPAAASQGAAQRSSSLPAPISPRAQASRLSPSATCEVYSSARPTHEPLVTASTAMDSPLRGSTARGSPAAAVRAVSQQRRLPPEEGQSRPSDPGPQAGTAAAPSRRPPLEAAPPRPPPSTAFSSPPATGGPGRPSSRSRGTGAGSETLGSAASGGAGGNATGSVSGGNARVRASSAGGAPDGPAKVVTGDAETDSEIAAFYAAMAELSKR